LFPLCSRSASPALGGVVLLERGGGELGEAFEAFHNDTPPGRKARFAAEKGSLTSSFVLLGLLSEP